MRHHHLAIGSSAQVSFASSEFGSGETVDAIVVGETLAPVLGESELADIEVVTYDTLAAAGVEVPPQLLLVDIDPRLDRAATIADLGNQLTEELTLDIVPARAVNMHRVRSLPLLGSALASMLAALVLGYTVISGARRHRRELATLRAVGLERRRVRRALAWQSGLIVGAVLALGVPLGLAAGAKVWTQVAHGTGISATTTVPAWLALPLAGLLATAAAIGAWVHHAQRGTLVTHLRAE
jgi:putative ABC transport system permease protein